MQTETHASAANGCAPECGQFRQLDLQFKGVQRHERRRGRTEVHGELRKCYRYLQRSFPPLARRSHVLELELELITELEAHLWGRDRAPW